MEKLTNEALNKKGFLFLTGQEVLSRCLGWCVAARRFHEALPSCVLAVHLVVLGGSCSSRHHIYILREEVRRGERRAAQRAHCCASCEPCLPGLPAFCPSCLSGRSLDVSPEMSVPQSHAPCSASFVLVCFSYRDLRSRLGLLSQHSTGSGGLNAERVASPRFSARADHASSSCAGPSRALEAAVSSLCGSAAGFPPGMRLPTGGSSMMTRCNLRNRSRSWRRAPSEGAERAGRSPLAS